MTTKVLVEVDAMTASWHDLLNVSTIDTDGDPQADLREPTYENVEIGESFGPVTLPLTGYRDMRYDFIAGGRNALKGVADDNGRQLAHPGSFSNELFEIYTLNYSASKIVGVHASEEIWLENAVAVGESLILQGQFVDKYEKRGQGYAVVEASAHDAYGNLVARRCGTEIMRTVPGDVVGRNAAPGNGSRRIETVLNRSGRRINAGMHDVAPGDWFELEPQFVTFEQAALYSRFGEYVTSIHGSFEAARNAGLAVPIVQGQQQMCHVIDGLLSVLGPGFHRGGHISAKFIRPVRVFSNLTFQGRVIVGEGNPDHVQIECWLVDETGKATTVATADWTKK